MVNSINIKNRTKLFIIDNIKENKVYYILSFVFSILGLILGIAENLNKDLTMCTYPNIVQAVAIENGGIMTGFIKMLPYILIPYVLILIIDLIGVVFLKYVVFFYYCRKIATWIIYLIKCCGLYGIIGAIFFPIICGIFVILIPLIIFSILYRIQFIQCMKCIKSELIKEMILYFVLNVLILLIINVIFCILIKIMF